MVLLASAYDQSRFFKAADLEQEKKLKIKNVTEETVGENKDRKLVCWFTNDARGLVLNRVNNRTLRGAYGDRCDGRVGKVVIAFPTRDTFRGQMIPVVRLRVPTPKEPVPVAPEPTDAEFNDEIDF
jgi:hypothetical protein